MTRSLRLVDLPNTAECRIDLSRTPLAVVDVEAAGALSGADAIVEIAIVRVDESGRISDHWATLVDPGRAIDWRARKVHGIDDGMVRDAPAFGDIAGEVLRRLDGAILVAHNISYEDRLLAMEFERLGLELLKMPGLCTLKLARRVLPTGTRTLGACAAYLGLELSDAHVALADAWATARMAKALMECSEPLTWPNRPPRLPTRSCRTAARPRAVELPAAGSPLTKTTLEGILRRSGSTTSISDRSPGGRGSVTPEKAGTRSGRGRVWCQPGVGEDIVETLVQHGYQVAKRLTQSVVAVVCTDVDADDDRTNRAREWGVMLVPQTDLSALELTDRRRPSVGRGGRAAADPPDRSREKPPVWGQAPIPPGFMATRPRTPIELPPLPAHLQRPFDRPASRAPTEADIIARSASVPPTGSEKDGRTGPSDVVVLAAFALVVLAVVVVAALAGPG